MKLENWSIISNGDPYKAPELQTQCLYGEVFDHSRFQDGEKITTSYIVGIDEEVVLTYSGSRYELGKVDSHYEEVYPNAKGRIITHLQKQ